MGHADWNDVLRLAVALIARQRAPFQIFSWLGLAFAALMFVEGIRVSFFPKRVAAVWDVAPVSPSKPIQANIERGVDRDSNGFAAKMSRATGARNSKRLSRAPRRQKFFRPGIRRRPGDPLRNDGQLADLPLTSDSEPLPES